MILQNRFDRGMTIFELMLVLSILSTFSIVLYGYVFKPALEAAKIQQVSGVMENIADAVEQYISTKEAPPPTLEATGYVPPPHPFGGSYGYSADVANGWVVVTAQMPAGRARAKGPGNSIINQGVSWDMATIKRTITREIWYDKQILYGE